MTPLSVFALLFVLCAVGRVLAATKAVPEGSFVTLNAIALYVCLPASIALNAPKLGLDLGLLGLISVPWLLLVFALGAVLAAARAFRFDRATTACVFLLVSLGNTSFLGYSLVPALAGEAALKYAVVYDQFGSFLMLSTVGLVVIALSAGKDQPTPRAIAWRVLSFPPFVALVLALTVVPAQLPAPLQACLALVAGALLPLVSLALGMQLRFSLPRGQRLPLGLAVGFKLVVLPLGALGLCKLLGLHGPERDAAVLESGMPTMITAGALLAMANVTPELAAAIVGYSTLGAAATLPLWRLVL